MRRSAEKGQSAQPAESSPLRFRSAVDQRGYTMLLNCVLYDRDLSDASVRTYMVLLDYARQDDAAFPGQDRLAADRDCTSRSIRNHLTELEEHGLITIEQRGLNLTNLYWIESVEEAYRGKIVPDRKISSTPERKFSSDPDWKIFADQDRQKSSDKADAVSSRHRNKKTATAESLDAAAESSTQMPELGALLVAAGMNRSDALRLAQSDPEECRRQLDYLPFAEIKKTPGAYLRAAIEQGFASPKGWQQAQKAAKRRQVATQERTANAGKEHSLSQATSNRERELERMRVESPVEYAAILAAAEAMLPQPIRNRPDGPAYKPALRDALLKALESLSADNHDLSALRN